MASTTTTVDTTAATATAPIEQPLPPLSDPVTTETREIELKDSTIATTGAAASTAAVKKPRKPRTKPAVAAAVSKGVSPPLKVSRKKNKVVATPESPASTSSESTYYSESSTDSDSDCGMMGLFPEVKKAQRFERKMKRFVKRCVQKEVRRQRCDSDDEEDHEAYCEHCEEAEELKRKKPYRKRRVLDQAATMSKYEERIRSELKSEDFAELNDAYVSDFGLVSKVTDVNANPPQHHAVVVSRLAAEYGYKIRGFTNENKSKGLYLTPLPNDEKRVEEGGTVRVVYVGGENPFKNSKHQASKYAVKKTDEVYVGAEVANTSEANTVNTTNNAATAANTESSTS